MALADLPLDMLDAGLQHLINWPFEDTDAEEFKDYFNNYIVDYWFNGCFPPRVWNCWKRDGKQDTLYLVFCWLLCLFVCLFVCLFACLPVGL